MPRLTFVVQNAEEGTARTTLQKEGLAMLPAAGLIEHLNGEIMRRTRVVDMARNDEAMPISLAHC